MRRMLYLAIAATTGLAAWAQNTPPAAPAPSATAPAGTPAISIVPATQPSGGSSETATQGEARIKAVCERLNLNEEQQRVADTLLQMFKAELEDLNRDMTRILEEIKTKYAELQDARQSGDKEREQRVREELRNLAPVRRAELHFYEGLRPALTSEQKQKLEHLLKRMDGGEGSLRPVQVMRAARGTSLTPVQEQQLEQKMADFRAKTAAQRTPSENPLLLEEFIREVRSILTTDQASRFDKLLEEEQSRPPQKTTIYVGDTEPPPGTPGVGPQPTTDRAPSRP